MSILEKTALYDKKTAPHSSCPQVKYRLLAANRQNMKEVCAWIIVLALNLAILVSAEWNRSEGKPDN